MATNPYDAVNSILNAARFRLNDAMPTLVAVSGNILDETQASTQQAFNSGYRKMQDAMCDAGAERFQDEIVITGIPAVTTSDPSVLCSMSWSEFYDGTAIQVSPVLPQNLILPLWMSERPTTPPSGPAFPFPRPDNPNMTCYTDGLPMFPKQQRNGCWEWKQDKIFFPGSQIVVDFRIRFRAYLADLADGATRWFEQPVPVMRCQDALSWWTVYEFAIARAIDGDATEQMLAVANGAKAEAIAATKFLVNRDVMKNERDDIRRIPYGGGSRGRRQL